MHLYKSCIKKIYSMNQFEILLLKANFCSSFLAKSLLIFLIIIISLFGTIRLYKRSFKHKLIRIFTLITTSLLPISIYLFYYPVYTGDLFETGCKAKTTIQFPKEKVLSIFVLPDCPYCHETIHLAKLLTARNPKLKIQFLVTGAHSDESFEPIKSKQIQVQMSKEIDKTIFLTKGVFPTYVISENGKLVKRWTNNEFGVIALDEIEEFTK